MNPIDIMKIQNIINEKIDFEKKWSTNPKFTALLTLILSSYVIFFSLAHVGDVRLSLLEQQNVGLNLSGFREECFETKLVEKYELVDKWSRTDKIDCLQNCGGSLKYCHYNEFIDTMFLCSPEGSSVLNKTVVACFEQCKSKYDFNNFKPFVRFFNESVCVKKFLVKSVIV